MGLTTWFATLIVLLTFGNKLGSSLSVNDYNAFKQLEAALIHGNTSSIHNLDILADTFFPRQSAAPLCASISYILEDPDSGMVDNHTFLWTGSYLPFNTGILLLSYAQSGITLKGFEWENTCLFRNRREISLQPTSFNYSDQVILNALGDLTSQLKAYAEADGIPKLSSSYRGYALNWDSSEEKLKRMDIVFTVHIILLNIFIVSSSLASSNFLYKRLYKNVKGKQKPGYALFWAIVFLSVVWNVGPSWLVLSRYDNKVYCSLAIVIPLQLLVALLVKKNPKFPIPGPWYNAQHSRQCAEDIHSLSRGVFLCSRCVVSHIVQVLSIWSLLVAFTFLMHYLTSIVVSLYLDPLNSLVKVVFIKAILVCFIVNVALLFVVESFTCKPKEVASSFLSVLSVVSALPILVVFLFMIGGIVFNEVSPQDNAWKPIFTLLPSALLLYATWFSHGKLFPKGRKDKDPGTEIVDDLEGGTPAATHSEATPLLPHSHSEDQTPVSI